MEKTVGLTFEGHDKLNRDGFSKRLEKYLVTDHQFEEGSLVVSLDAPFGSGKTHFLSMWRNSLEMRRKNDQSVPRAVLINAWESDYCGDPLMSIVTALIEVTKPESEEEANLLSEAAKDIGWFAVGLTNSMAEHWSGLNPVEAGKLAEEKRKERKPEKPDFVRLYESRTKALHNLKLTLGKVFESESPKAFVFVDELDRCRPDYAVSYLETIKHIFDIHGLVFILAIDRGQLESSAKHLFGTRLEFQDYFRKFAHRSVSLPASGADDIQRLASHYAARYIEIAGKRSSFLSFTNRIEEIVPILTALRMRPRQMQEAFRTLGHAMSRSTEQKGALHFGLEYGTILMACLKSAGHQLYFNLATDQPNLKLVADSLVKLLGKDLARWWFMLYFTTLPNAASAAAFGASGLEVGSPEQFGNEVSQFRGAWGSSLYGTNRWRQIVELIETADTFK